MYCTPEGLEVPKESLGTGLIEWLWLRQPLDLKIDARMTLNYYIYYIINIIMYNYNSIILSNCRQNQYMIWCPHFYLKPFLAAVETHSVAGCQHQFEKTHWQISISWNMEICSRWDHLVLRVLHNWVVRLQIHQCGHMIDAQTQHLHVGLAVTVVAGFLIVWRFFGNPLGSRASS